MARTYKKPPEPVSESPPSLPLFPPRAVPQYARGTKKKSVSIRFPEALQKVISAAKARGWSATQVVVDAVTFAQDATSLLEPMWLLVQHEAAKQGVSVGVLVGRLAFKGLADLYPDFASKLDGAAKPDNNKKK